MKINQLMALSAHAEEERKLLKESLSRDEEYLYGLMVMDYCPPAACDFEVTEDFKYTLAVRLPCHGGWDMPFLTRCVMIMWDKARRTGRPTFMPVILAWSLARRRYPDEVVKADKRGKYEVAVQDWLVRAVLRPWDVPPIEAIAECFDDEHAKV